MRCQGARHVRRARSRTTGAWRSGHDSSAARLPHAASIKDFLGPSHQVRIIETRKVLTLSCWPTEQASNWTLTTFETVCSRRSATRNRRSPGIRNPGANQSVGYSYSCPLHQTSHANGVLPLRRALQVAGLATSTFHRHLHDGMFLGWPGHCDIPRARFG